MEYNLWKEFPKETRLDKFLRLFLEGQNSKPPTLEDEFRKALDSGKDIKLSIYEGHGPPRFKDYYVGFNRRCDQIEDFFVGVSLSIEGVQVMCKEANYKKEINKCVPAEEEVYEKLRDSRIKDVNSFAKKLENIANSKGVKINLQKEVIEGINLYGYFERIVPTE